MFRTFLASTFTLLALVALPPTLSAKVPTEPNAQIPTPGKVTLLEVSSYYCVPCRIMKPRMASLSKTFDDTGKAKIFVVDVEDDPSLIDRYEIDVTPTLLLFDASGKVMLKMKGMREEKDLERLIKELL